MEEITQDLSPSILQHPWYLKVTQLFHLIPAVRVNSQLSKEVYLWEILLKFLLIFKYILPVPYTSWPKSYPLGYTLKHNHSAFHLWPVPPTLPTPCLLFSKVQQFWGSTIWAKLNCMALLLILSGITLHHPAAWLLLGGLKWPYSHVYGLSWLSAPCLSIWSLVP